jgi:hypothetical protein
MIGIYYYVSSEDTGDAPKKEDTTKEDITKEDTKKEDTKKEDTKKEDTTKEDTKKEDTTKEDTKKKDTDDYSKMVEYGFRTVDDKEGNPILMQTFPESLRSDYDPNAYGTLFFKDDGKFKVFSEEQPNTQPYCVWKHKIKLPFQDYHMMGIEKGTTCDEGGEVRKQESVFWTNKKPGDGDIPMCLASQGNGWPNILRWGDSSSCTGNGWTSKGVLYVKEA